MRSSSQSGQSLIEVVVAISVGIFVVAALAFATIATLRNAQLAQNQAQATKLGQEGLERVRVARDRNAQFVNFPPVTDWQNDNLWNGQINSIGACNPCNFQLEASNNLRFLAGSSSTDTALDGRFTRTIILTDDTSGSPPRYTLEKQATVLVSWTDFSGSHESRLTTILRRL